MTKVPEFDELIGADAPAEERERLRRVHELLVAAGPPAELPPSLETVPEPEPKVTLLPQRRRFTVIGLAAALALVAFGAGYVAGGFRGGGSSTVAVVAMHGTPAAPAASGRIRLLSVDEAGNWPMKFSVEGLKRLPKGGYYELYLTKRGRPAATCGIFTVHGGTTVVRLNAPYPLREYDGWVVTRHLPSQRGYGPVLLTT